MSSASPDAAFWSGRRVTVTGGGGFLGRPVLALLESLGADVTTIRSADHDLRDRGECFAALEGAQVVLNLAVGLNVFEACRELGVEKLVSAGSVCAYPKFAGVPFREDEIWNGYPEES